MGHLLKNTKFKTAGYALGVPGSISSSGPDNPVVGQMRYNTTTNKLEFYNNTLWNAVAREGNVLISQDNFTANSLNSEYGPMNRIGYTGWEANVLVHVGTVYQIPGTNYTFYGNNIIHFTGGLSNGAAITIIHGFASTTAV